SVYLSSSCSHLIPINNYEFIQLPRPPPSTLFPYTTLFRSWINDHHRLEPSLPWGGIKESGTGRDAGSESFDDFTWIKTVVARTRSEEHTSELQSRENLVCRLLLEKKQNRLDETTYQ